jgi:hypothetical protein
MSRIDEKMMADQSDNIIPVLLGDIRATQKSSETQLRHAPQESRLDELFHKLEQLLSDKMPV